MIFLTLNLHLPQNFLANGITTSCFVLHSFHRCQHQNGVIKYLLHCGEELKTRISVKKHSFGLGAPTLLS